MRADRSLLAGAAYTARTLPSRATCIPNPPLRSIPNGILLVSSLSQILFNTGHGIDRSAVLGAWLFGRAASSGAGHDPELPVSGMGPETCP